MWVPEEHGHATSLALPPPTPRRLPVRATVLHFTPPSTHFAAAIQPSGPDDCRRSARWASGGRHRSGSRELSTVPGFARSNAAGRAPGVIRTRTSPQRWRPHGHALLVSARGVLSEDRCDERRTSAAGRRGHSSPSTSAAAPRRAGSRARIETVVEGKPDVVRLAIAVLLAEGHLLIEDVPGVGKTMLAKALAASIDCTRQADPVHARPAAERRHRRQRLQPGDAASSSSSPARSSPTSSSATRSTAPRRRPSRRCWSAWRSARSPSTGRPTSSARRSWSMATQNPVEMEGTYPLPEAQRDRFMARVSMGYPDQRRRARRCSTRHGGADPLDDLEPVADAAEVAGSIDAVRGVHVLRRGAAVRRRPGRPRPAAPPTCGSAPRPARRLQLLRAARACGRAGRPRLRAARRHPAARRPGPGPPAAAHRRGADRPARRPRRSSPTSCAGPAARDADRRAAERCARPCPG